MTLCTRPWPAGTPCSVDLRVPGRRCLSPLLRRRPRLGRRRAGEQYGGCVIASARGVAAAGIGPAREGARTDWTLYLASDDVDATVAQLTGHGGALILPPRDVGSLGRMAIAADPSGARALRRSPRGRRAWAHRLPVRIDNRT